MENALKAISTLLPAKDNTIGQQDNSALDSVKNTSSSSAPAVVGDGVDTTVDSEIAPAVEHVHVKKQHELREQTVIEKERHQDHYHTTVQPLKASEVLPEKHEYQQETKEREINKDDGAARAKAERERQGFQNTVDEEQYESQLKEPTQVQEHVHHHLHETVVPVIEKEVVDPTITHKRIDVHEKIIEPSQNHGITTNQAIPVEEFQAKIAGAKDVLPTKSLGDLNDNSQQSRLGSSNNSGNQNDRFPSQVTDQNDDLLRMEDRAGNSAESLKNKTGDYADQAGNTADEFSKQVGDAANQAGKKANELADKAGDKANDLLNKASDKADALAGNDNY